MPVLSSLFARKALSLNTGASASDSMSWLDRMFATTDVITPASSMQRTAVYSSTTIIAQSIGTLPVRFVARDDKQRTTQYPEAVRALWTEPNPDQTRNAFWETCVMSLLLWGNFYGVPVRNDRGDLIAIWPLDPDRLWEIERAADGVTLLYHVHGFESPLVNTPGKPHQMLHIKGITLPGRIQGISPITQARLTLDLNQSAEMHAARFLSQGVHMSGTIEVPTDLTREAAEELWAAFQMRHGGNDNAGKVGILTGGASFKTITIPPSELQFLEQMEFSDKRIYSIYRVPAFLIGQAIDAGAYAGAGLEEQEKAYAKYTLQPWITKIEQSIEATFLRDTNVQMKFNMNAHLRPNTRDRAEFYSRMFAIGVYSQNDIREKEDEAPIEGGDTYYVPLNYAPTGAPPVTEGSR
jgi:HK97 family phage portal protein